MLLPRTCPVCLAVGPAPCDRCLGLLRPAPALPPPPGVDRCLALVAYEGAGAVLVRQLKYRNHRDAVSRLGAALAAGLAGEGDLLGASAAVTWVPAAVDHRRQRGFDQGELLARALARNLPGVRARRLLDRRPGPAQTGRDRPHRLVGPALELRRGARVAATVVVVDDVRTTGASLAAAAAVLRSGGARTVVAATIATTPTTLAA